MFGVSTVVGNTTSENRDDIYTVRLTTRYTGTTSRAKFQSVLLVFTQRIATVLGVSLDSDLYCVLRV